ncbi:DUF6289 family protein [Pseudoxanthomonas helianthi]|uniref:DUF6289 family protein n=1 Tax=Pseudoxanthomonas helianthi TaxID=1453541 RepID=UPI003CCD3C53
MLYYQDAAKTILVGEKTVFCDGTTEMEGIRTQYATQVTEPCSPPVPDCYYWYFNAFGEKICY